MTPTYDERYAQLTKAQQKAVDSLDGPVMVVAGPGTGKTQVLAMRIANILRNDQINPQNILALTFTDSAVHAMRERLVRIMGSTAYDVSLHTFHSFCNSVIGEHTENFLFKATLDHCTEVEQYRFIRDILAEHTDLGSIKPFAAPFYYQDALLSCIQSLKRENFSPEDFKQVLKSVEEKFTARTDTHHEKGAHKGKMKAEMKVLAKNIQKAKSAQVVYKEYQDKFSGAGLYDYDDMILFVVRELQKNPDLLLDVQQRYHYILVDEFQDTNSAQNTLVTLLGNYFDTPNIFVVGDDDQSIYRFQGAALENILSFSETYKNPTVIVLQDNFRSTEPILQASAAVIAHNTERLVGRVAGISKDLQAHVTYPKIPVSITSFPSEDSENAFLVRSIQELLEQGVSPKEIALLYRRNSQGERLADLLQREGIPFVLSSGKNILETPLIQQVLALLKLIAQPLRWELFFPVLYFPWLGIDSLDTLYILKYGSSLKKDEDALIEHLLDPLLTPELQLRNVDTVKAFAEKIIAWQKDSVDLTFPVFLEKVLEESGLFRYLAADERTPDSVRVYELNLIRSLFNNTKTMGLKNYKFGLHDFLNDVALLEETRSGIPEIDLEYEAEAVNLLTAHKAKGLEFPYVFLPQATRQFWNANKHGGGIPLPAELVYHAEEKSADDDEHQLEEERRLFYVAMTRAQKKLAITYAKLSGTERKQEPAVFVQQIIESEIPSLVSNDYQETIASTEDILANIFAQPIKDVDQVTEEHTVIRTILKDFTVSPTALNTYLTCPKKFKLGTLLRFPSVKEKSSSFGSIVHRVLRSFTNEFMQNKKLPPATFFAEAIRTEASREPLGATDLQEVVEKAENILTAYYRFYSQSMQPNTLKTEYTISGVYLDEIPLKGTFDKVELLDATAKTVQIVDYKTGKVKSRNTILGETKSGNGDYFRQLVFYKLLADLSPTFPYTMEYGVIDFLEPKDDEGTEFSREVFSIDEIVLDNLKTTIRETWKKIQAQEFPKKSKPDRDCEYCSFASLCWQTMPHSDE